MMWVFLLIALVLLGEGFRLRARLRALPRLPTSPADMPPMTHRLLVASGVTVLPPVERAARAYAASAGADLLDIVPANLPALQNLALAQFLDPSQLAHNPFTPLGGAGHAVLVHTELLARAGKNPNRSYSREGLSQLVADLKPFAPLSSAVVVAPELAALPETVPARLAQLKAFGRGPVLGLVYGLPLLLAIFFFAVLSNQWVGFLAILAWHLHPIIAHIGAFPAPSDAAESALQRLFREGQLWWAAVHLDPHPGVDLPKLRAKYATAVASGLDRFFEPRRAACPSCGDGRLLPFITTEDLLQQKPGTFHLERCANCALVFQNPRLSLDGLNYYYADFYEGLGEDVASTMFAVPSDAYRRRAAMVLSHTEPEPRRWLDVGTGHGHFCLSAKVVAPSVSFDGLDLSESIDEAARRGWVRKGFRGLFPELAPSLAGQYDVVSMSHYLEHTREPQAEIAAAYTALAPGGLLFIEQPDPDSKMGKWLGRWWLPWFQPQHQHLPAVRHAEKWLHDVGFEVVAWDRTGGHAPVDLGFAVMLLGRKLAGNPGVPWLPEPAPVDKARHGLAWALVAPFMLVAMLMDRLIQPFMRRPGGSNAYCVLARRPMTGVSAASHPSGSSGGSGISMPA
jgi:SAM-dependent methyltransferase